MVDINHWLKYDWQNRKGNAIPFFQSLRHGLIKLGVDQVKEIIDTYNLQPPEGKALFDKLKEQSKEYGDRKDDIMNLPESFLHRNFVKV